MTLDVLKLIAILFALMWACYWFVTLGVRIWRFYLPVPAAPIVTLTFTDHTMDPEDADREARRLRLVMGDSTRIH
jgi:hypothetical protein